MTYNDKFSLIISALLEAKKMAREGYYSKLYASEEPLSKIGTEIINDILLKLQDDEKIISIKDTPTSLKFVTIRPTSDLLDPKSYFLIDFLDDFDNWFARYQIKEKGKISNLSEANFNAVYSVMSQLEDEMQISQSDKFVLCFVNSIHDIQGYDSEDVDALADGYLKILEYLKKIDVIKEYSHGTMSLDAEVTLNVTRYLEVWETAKQIKQSQSGIKPTNIPVAKDNKQANYDPSRGLLTIGSKTVKLNKDSFRTKLIELLLKNEKNRKKEWSWDEVIEAIEDTKDKEMTKESKDKFYPACDGLSKLIAQKVGINDLLIFNKSTVQINSKYL